MAFNTKLPLISFKRRKSLRHARESKSLIQQNSKTLNSKIHVFTQEENQCGLSIFVNEAIKVGDIQNTQVLWQAVFLAASPLASGGFAGKTLFRARLQDRKLRRLKGIRFKLYIKSQASKNAQLFSRSSLSPYFCKKR